MELTELLRLLVEKLAPLIEVTVHGCKSHDPDGDIEFLVETANRVLDSGLLIGRGV